MPVPFDQVKSRMPKALGGQSYQACHAFGYESQNRTAEFPAKIAGTINGHMDVKGRPLSTHADLFA